MASIWKHQRLQKHILIDRYRQNSITRNVKIMRMVCVLCLLQYMAEYNLYQTETVLWLLFRGRRAGGRVTKAFETTLIRYRSDMDVEECSNFADLR